MHLMWHNYFFLHSREKQVFLTEYTEMFVIAGGMATFYIIVNCYIHVLMYTYYFLSTLGPEWQRKLGYIKPKLTILQMVIIRTLFIIIGVYEILLTYILLLNIWATRHNNSFYDLILYKNFCLLSIKNPLIGEFQTKLLWNIKN